MELEEAEVWAEELEALAASAKRSEEASINRMQEKLAESSPAMVGKDPRDLIRQFGG